MKVTIFLLKPVTVHFSRRSEFACRDKVRESERHQLVIIINLIYLKKWLLIQFIYDDYALDISCDRGSPDLDLFTKQTRTDLNLNLKPIRSASSARTRADLNLNLKAIRSAQSARNGRGQT